MAYPRKNPFNALEACPPFLAYALAREHDGKHRLKLAVIVKRSGLSERTFLRMARKDSWDDVRYGVIKKMLAGCGIDVFNFNKHRRFLRDHAFQIPYLNKKQKAVLDEICARRLQKSKGGID